MNSLLLGDCLPVMRTLDDDSIDLIVTSPPYAMQRKATYGGIPADQYVGWFIERAAEMQRILKPTGSLVVNIKEHFANGERSTYVMELVFAMRNAGWRWLDEFIWHKRNSMPTNPAERCRDMFERCHHFAPARDRIYIDKKAVRKPITEMTAKRYAHRSRNDGGMRVSSTGSGNAYNMDRLRQSPTAMPTNVLHLANATNARGHSAAYPIHLPEFFIKMLSPRDGIVLDPFAGSGTTCIAARRLGRKYIGIELNADYHRLATERLAAEQPLMQEE